MLTALPRLERIYRSIIDERLDVDIDVVRVADVDRCYHLLRQIDWTAGSDAAAHRHIVLDLATNTAVQKVLRQVRLHCPVILEQTRYRAGNGETICHPPTSAAVCQSLVQPPCECC